MFINWFYIHIKILCHFLFKQANRILLSYYLIHKEGITKRIDRLIINKNKKQIWIIDYKLSQINEEDYNDQIKEYIFLR